MIDFTSDVFDKKLRHSLGWFIRLWKYYHHSNRGNWQIDERLREVLWVDTYMLPTSHLEYRLHHRACPFIQHQPSTSIIDLCIILLCGTSVCFKHLLRNQSSCTVQSRGTDVKCQFSILQNRTRLPTRGLPLLWGSVCLVIRHSCVYCSFKALCILGKSFCLWTAIINWT